VYFAVRHYKILKENVKNMLYFVTPPLPLTPPFLGNPVPAPAAEQEQHEVPKLPNFPPWNSKRTNNKFLLFQNIHAFLKTIWSELKLRRFLIGRVLRFS
jgi:hypothetical protein